MPAYPKRITKVEIGKSASDHLDVTALEYASERVVGNGPGGDLVIPKIVLNTTRAVDVGFSHKWWEITIGLAEDEFKALFDTPVGDSLKAVVMDGVNTEIGHLAVTREFADGATDTRFYDKTRVAGVSPTKLTNKDGKYIVEIKFISAEGILDIQLPFIDETEDWPFNSLDFLNAVRSDTCVFNSVTEA